MSASYKTLKEKFVSDLSGGSIGEVNLVTAVAPAAYFLWSLLQSRHISFRSATRPVDALVDLLLNVGAIVAATTLYSSSPLLLLALLLAPALLLYLAFPPAAVRNRTRVQARRRNAQDATSKEEAEPRDANEEANVFPPKPFLTAYRGAMLVVTCHAILAVDFRAFPRRFAKVETWGTSLMDMGVGSFVFSAGLVAAKPFVRQQSESCHDDRKRSQKSNGNVGKEILQTLRQSAPLLALGTARLISVKRLDYAEHVSEYGVHWNFFFTLAVLPFALRWPIQPLVRTAVRLLPGGFPVHGLAGFVLIVAYELALQLSSLKAWALTAPRMTLIAKNKEGIVSWLGYLAIFLFGIEAGTIVLPRSSDAAGRVGLTLTQFSRYPRAAILTVLTVSGIIYSVLLGLLISPYPWGLSISVSRRLANAPYVFWVAAFNCVQLVLFAAVEFACFAESSTSRPSPSPNLSMVEFTPESFALADFNSGGLLIFLAANLITGAINISIDTLSIGDKAATLLLLAYMTALAITARALAILKGKRKWSD